MPISARPARCRAINRLGGRRRRSAAAPPRSLAETASRPCPTRRSGHPRRSGSSRADTDPDSTDVGSARIDRRFRRWPSSPPGRARQFQRGSTDRSLSFAGSPKPTTLRSFRHSTKRSTVRMGGTVELADEGPHFVDDLRFSGESRLIRARTGYRPIIRVERSSQEAVRDQPAVFMLDKQGPDARRDRPGRERS